MPGRVLSTRMLLCAVKYSLVLTAVALLASAPGHAQEPDSAPAAARVAADAPIQSGDRIVLKVWQEKTMNDTLLVDQNSNIVLPELGVFSVPGQTVGTPPDSLRVRYSGLSAQLLDCRHSPAPRGHGVPGAKISFVRTGGALDAGHLQTVEGLLRPDRRIRAVRREARAAHRRAEGGVARVSWRAEPAKQPRAAAAPHDLAAIPAAGRWPETARHGATVRDPVPGAQRAVAPRPAGFVRG